MHCHVQIISIYEDTSHSAKSRDEFKPWPTANLFFAALLSPSNLLRGLLLFVGTLWLVLNCRTIHMGFWNLDFDDVRSTRSKTRHQTSSNPVDAPVPPIPAFRSFFSPSPQLDVVRHSIIPLMPTNVNRADPSNNTLTSLTYWILVLVISCSFYVMFHVAAPHHSVSVPRRGRAPPFPCARSAPPLRLFELRLFEPNLNMEKAGTEFSWTFLSNSQAWSHEFCPFKGQLGWDSKNSRPWLIPLLLAVLPILAIFAVLAILTVLGPCSDPSVSNYL